MCSLLIGKMFGVDRLVLPCYVYYSYHDIRRLGGVDRCVGAVDFPCSQPASACQTTDTLRLKKGSSQISSWDTG